MEEIVIVDDRSKILENFKPKSQTKNIWNQFLYKHPYHHRMIVDRVQEKSKDHKKSLTNFCIIQIDKELVEEFPQSRESIKLSIDKGTRTISLSIGALIKKP